MSLLRLSAPSDSFRPSPRATGAALHSGGHDGLEGGRHAHHRMARFLVGAHGCLGVGTEALVDEAIVEIAQELYTDRVEGLPIEGPEKVEALTRFCDERFGAGAWEPSFVSPASQAAVARAR